MAPTKKAAAEKKADKPAGKVSKKNDAPPQEDASATSGKGDKPKGALTAYFCFMRENRETIKVDGTQKTFVKAAAAEWKKLEDKSKYEQMAKEDKERYQRELAEYNRQ
uniref:HMG box domain-containing protein n=1 Tax=Panagrolaimus sp. PS1159 TaxID=55785 RepID=A0AC35EXZ6_9BILA